MANKQYVKGTRREKESIESQHIVKKTPKSTAQPYLTKPIDSKTTGE